MAKTFPWKVISYLTADGEDPVTAFILSLPPKDQKKVRQTIAMLVSQGIAIREPAAKAIVGQSGLFELRSQIGNNIQRIFYFHYTHRTFVLLHAFTKKQQRTPAKEIQKAIDNRNDFLRRSAIDNAKR
jgi:phage-related protein